MRNLPLSREMAINLQSLAVGECKVLRQQLNQATVETARCATKKKQ